ncbi:hypothetical protein BDW42DRAFT_158056 [Aspergillus taichungensis]|uniref:Uncharacterized protein n=1 Tax=Aspergillus taichungensis TaxID=482145 RepID=A0A2J5IA35_9EURO|nr:hypothetical protein BDW42DRAFT_158056 [Aspergillus taichungensis]
MSLDLKPDPHTPGNCAKEATTWEITERSWIPSYLSGDCGIGSLSLSAGRSYQLSADLLRTLLAVLGRIVPNHHLKK